MKCELCGQPAGSRIEHEGHVFCCIGCREVYLHFGSFPDPESGREPGPETAQPAGSEAYLRVDGMHCASCELLIEKHALGVDGIVAANVSYATGTAKIIYDPELVGEEDLPELVSRSGYVARFSHQEKPEYDYRMPMLRLVTGQSLAATVMMMYLAFYYPVHIGLVELEELQPIDWLVHEAVPAALLVLTTIMIVYVAAPIFRGAWIGLKTGILNMDNLLAIAILAAYGFSIGQMMLGTLDLYFDVVAAIIAVVTIGRYFEREAKEDAIRELSTIMDAWTPRARVMRQDEPVMVTIDELMPAERIRVHQGELIPADGIIVEGECAVDESLMTGEPFPVSRTKGDRVLGGTRNVEGSLEIEVGHVVTSQMVNLARVLWNAQSTTAGTPGMGDHVARYFVPAVLVLALGVGVWFYSGGATFGTALLALMATLIVSCPCTFGLAIPLTSAVGVTTALRNGIIFTGADVFNKARQIDTIAMDKTGVLSTANMKVSRISGPPEMVGYAAAVERLSPHPIAEAIARLDSRYHAENVEIHPGKGAVADVDDHRVAVGSMSLFDLLGWDTTRYQQVSAPGNAVNSYIGWDGVIHGMITTEDQPREDWSRVVSELRRKAKVVLLTGAETVGTYRDHFDEVFSRIPPEGKAAVIRQLKRQGTVVMIGDGSNDAPSLAQADLGIAFGSPTALAADAADVIIPGGRLDRVFLTFDLLGTVQRRIRQNLLWALLYNAIAIPVAVTGMLNPLFAAVAMSSSSLLVVWNSIRKLAPDEPPEPADAALQSA
ncbi:MAG: cation-translocating P-type ATPase [Gammaproteobacteria bacterium]|nr:cation-translocating P-type ATPase [Gammaproteobacteria bacterium]